MGWVVHRKHPPQETHSHESVEGRLAVPTPMCSELTFLGGLSLWESVPGSGAFPESPMALVVPRFTTAKSPLRCSESSNPGARLPPNKWKALWSQIMVSYLKEIWYTKGLPTLRASVWFLPTARGLQLVSPELTTKFFQPSLQVKAFSNTWDL